MGERGRGHVYLQHGTTWYLQFYQTENREGKLVKVRKSVKLADKDREHNSATCKAIKVLRDRELAKITNAPTITAEDMRVVEYWEQRFLPWCQEVLETGPRKGQPRKKPTTIKDYKWIWEKFLKHHFGTCTLQKYQPHMAERYLDSLTAKRGWHILRHIRTTGSAIFKRALKEKIITMNPWHDVEMPEDAVKPEGTPHYTREQSEDLVTALVDHVDCQLVLSLACFLALGPAEIAGLRWEDIDKDWLHVRRNVVFGEEGTTKTIERAASLPLLDEVRVPLELWRKERGKPATGWLFGDKPIDLHNLVARVIRPHVDGERYGKQCTRCKVVPEASRVEWRGMYSARRGAITHAINVSGNIALGQRLARHKDAATTTAFYHKTMPDAMFLEGMKQLKK
ncbi:MAG TPA: site-specific integrase [Candidatus Sulfotelmatobacter sp.]|nr:site-specific integrase [Candidatus Sulfotelmatobacter sp.]